MEQREAKKNFRKLMKKSKIKRYGNSSTFEYESDLSLNSDEEESEESETQ